MFISFSLLAVIKPQHKSEQVYFFKPQTDSVTEIGLITF